MKSVDPTRLGRNIVESIVHGDDVPCRARRPEDWLLRHVFVAIKRLLPEAVTFESEVPYPAQEFRGDLAKLMEGRRCDFVLRRVNGEQTWFEVKYFAAGADSHKKSQFEIQTLLLEQLVAHKKASQAVAVALFDFYTDRRLTRLVAQVIKGELWSGCHCEAIDRQSPIKPSLPAWLAVSEASRAA